MQEAAGDTRANENAETLIHLSHHGMNDDAALAAMHV